MIQLTIVNAQIEISERDDGIRLLSALDPETGIRVVVPMPPEAARELASALAGGIVLADVVPLAPEGT